MGSLITAAVPRLRIPRPTIARLKASLPRILKAPPAPPNGR